MQVSLTQLPWYGQIGAFVVVSALGVFGFYNFYARDVYAEIAGQQTRLEGLRGDINKGLATARRLQEFQAEVNDLKLRLDALKSILTVRTFSPQAVVTKDIHAEWPIKLQVEGTYHNLGLFFDRISKFPRLINVGDVRIRALSQPQPNATIMADCTATTFVLLDAAAATAAPATPGRG